MMRRKKIHIASIQETHIPHGQNYKFNGYRIITSKAEKQNTDGMPIGGAAILIHEDLAQHIVHIHRVNHRIVKIILRSEESHAPITIINTYEPHRGKTKLEQSEHWEKVQEIIAPAQKKNLTIWCADANGQMETIEQEEEKPRRICGPYRKQDKAEKGNGKNKSVKYATEKIWS